MHFDVMKLAFVLTIPIFFKKQVEKQANFSSPSAISPFFAFSTTAKEIDYINFFYCTLSNNFIIHIHVFTNVYVNLLFFVYLDQRQIHLYKILYTVLVLPFVHL